MTRSENRRRDVVCLADVKAEPVRWLWEGRIPLAKLTILDGNPGDGKTTITADIAARLSNGGEMPDGTRVVDAPAATLFMSAEDGLGDTLRPRLVAAGARLDLIHALPHVTGGDGTRRLPRLPEDVDAIADAVRHKRVMLIVIDPLMAFLGARTDSYRDQSVRAALQPLAHLAEETGAAIMLVRHLTKSSKNRSPIHSGGGSVGIIGAARAAFIVGPDPDDSARRVLAANKSNLSTSPLSLSYSIESAGDAGRVVWHGPSPHDAHALQSAPAHSDRGPMVRARAFLQELIASAGGCVAAKEAKARAVAENITPRTLERARLALGYVSERVGYGEGGAHFWRSPNDAHSEQAKVPSGAPPIFANGLDNDLGELGEHGQERSAIAYAPKVAEPDSGDHVDDSDDGSEARATSSALKLAQSGGGEHGEHGGDREHHQERSADGPALILASGDGGENVRVGKHVAGSASAATDDVILRTGPGGAAVRFHHHGDEDWVALTDFLKAHDSKGTVVDKGLPCLLLPNGHGQKLKVIPTRALAQRLRDRPELIAKLQGEERAAWLAFLEGTRGAA
jgi:hypothetical protein